MSLFQDNLDSLRKSAPTLVSAVLDTAGGRLTISPSREGSPTAKARDQWLHSAYDPRNEAQLWAQAQAKEWQSGEVGVILGVGLL